MSQTEFCSLTTVLSIISLHLLIVTSAHDFSTSYSQTPEDFVFQNELKFIYKYKGASDNPYSALNVSNVSYITTSPPVTRRKWQIGRVSRKHYEIVNMLWRRTNVFKDVDYTSDTPLDISTKPQHTAQLKRHAQDLYKTSMPSTISYIEFYYLDENVDPTNVKLAKPPRERRLNVENFINSPFTFAFHMNPSYVRRTSLPVPERLFTTTQVTPEFYSTTVERNYLQKALPTLEIKPLLSNSHYLQNFLLNNAAERHTIKKEITNTGTTTTEKTLTRPISTTRTNNNEDLKNENEMINHTTPNDKIKFFELYDNNTFEPETTPPFDYNVTYFYSKNIADITKTVEAMNQTESKHVTIKMKHSKKDVQRQNIMEKEKLANAVKFSEPDQALIRSFRLSFKPYDSQENIFNLSKNLPESPKLREHLNLTPKQRNVTWSEYPFAAVYVYERFQVHCDAAAISPHWLIASGSCLSRHQNYLYAEERSAFVTYCGETWWSPERITYVKYTQVHPRYDRRDLVRRHLYNIGVIQVVTSMASSCLKWAPVTVMSHQYVAELEGSVGSAVGWGLDRYDTSYATSDLPRHPLSLYDGVIYSNSCPGNTGYSDTQKISKEAVTAVYCLSLPNYTDEQHDPVHGGMLLVGGKLIALYLQEERQQWGSQSAQYTGIWRLMPWLLDVAKEPEEMDFSL